MAGEKNYSWHYDMLFAFEEAASGIESWEWGGADTDEEYARQKEAATEVARRIRRMANRYERKHIKAD